MATKETLEIKMRLKTLKKELDRNEELMRKAAIAYENLIAEKQALESSIANLRNLMRNSETANQPLQNH